MYTLPLLALFMVISRFFPIFWVGYPLLNLLGLISLIVAVGFFIPVLENAFSETFSLIKTFFTFVSLLPFQL